MSSRSNKVKPHQYRNLTFHDHRPRFLANIHDALSGTKPTDQESKLKHSDDEETEVLDPSRPAIPIRPRERNYHQDEDDEVPTIVSEHDLSGMGRLSDEDEDIELEQDAPQVVVIKQGRHLTKEEFEAEKMRLRHHPHVESSVPSSSRQSIKPSLKFSSNDKSTNSNMGKRKHQNFIDDQNDHSWQDLTKIIQNEKNKSVTNVKEKHDLVEKSSASKKQRKLDLKAKNKKAKSLMSFS